MDHLIRDLRHACRSIVRMPLLATVIVLSLGAAIGVNTTVFSFVQSRVLRPLPGVDDAGGFQLVEARAETGSYPGMSWLEYRDLQERLRAFEQIFAFRMQALTVGEAAQVERTSGMLVSGNYFSALGLAPAAGRLMQSEDARRPGGEPVAVLSHDYWQNRYAGSAAAIGQTIRVNGMPLTIIGVTPDEFQGTVIGIEISVWVPATLAPVLLNGSRELEQRSARGYQVAGRLAGTTAQAQTELDAAMSDLAIAYPETNAALQGEVMPFWQAPRGPQRMLVRALTILQGIMLVLLLAVCGNTALLLLERAGSRRQEVGVRLAVGADPMRVARLLLTENVVLALMGAAVGVVIAIWGTRVLGVIPLTTGFPVRMRTDVDLIGLMFAVALAIVSAAIFGAGPAAQLARVDPLRALRSGQRTTSRGWIGHALMGTQVALALMVLIAAGVFYQNLREARDVNPGFTREGVLLARYDLTGRGVAPSASREFARRALDGMRQIPGVEAAAIAQQVPLDIHGLPLMSFALEGRARIDGALDRALSNVVTPGYFQTMNIAIAAGRDFVALDDVAAPREAIVNEAFVQRYVQDAEPLGRRLQIAGRIYAVVGIVRNSVSDAFGEAPAPCIYFSYRDRPAPVGQLHARTQPGNESQLAGSLRAVVAAIDPSLPTYDIRTLTEHVEANLGLRKIPAQMFMFIGPLLLALAAIGMYAVVAYTVAHRTSEIGVRLALGATAHVVVAQIVQDHMRVVAIGSVVGWVAAYIAHDRLVQEPIDVAVFVIVPMLLLVVAAIATLVPAMRASHIDPIMALRTNES
jgi:predicted permease